jgi:hypothetical protein
MPYTPTDEPGRAWLRPSSVILSHPASDSPVLQFNEEEVTALGGGKALAKPYGPLVAPVDPERVVPLVDRATGLLSGQTMTLGEILAAVHSAYVAIAKDRDAPAA